MKQLENVQILWHLDYWDGPLSGVLLHENEICYFDLLEEFVSVAEDPDDIDTEYDFGWYRKYNVYKLTDDDKIRLITTHALWQGHMGLHTDYFPFNGRGIINKKLKDNNEGKVPNLHYGPTGRSDKAYEDYIELKEKWEQDCGKFEKDKQELIGFVYYDQLFGEKRES